MHYYELNIDGLVGPTHNYAGLSPGNIASIENALSVANPQAAALQGLDKMRFLHQLGLKQALMPPHQRPNLNLLAELGFTGTIARQLEKANKFAPELLAAAYSASSMWTANAATVSASLDTQDKRLHFTAANLVSNLHRQQEALFSQHLLKALFADDNYFYHHPALPPTTVTSDEGAANFNRLSKGHNYPGLSLFVYGKKAWGSTGECAPKKYPARQTYEASVFIARSHGLDPKKVIFAQQNPEVIDQGVFHNDVIGVANESVIFLHQHAFLQQREVLAELQAKADFPLTIIEVPENELSVTDAVASYLFNSQLLSQADGSMFLLAPKECENNPRVRNYLQRLIDSGSTPLKNCFFLDLKQSMRNGGGPACLRLRVLVNDNELKAMHQGVLLSDQLFSQLELWIKQHYRDRLSAADLVDPALVYETCGALEELTSLLKLGSIYPFQQEPSL